MAEYIEREALQAALMRKRCGVANQRYTEGWNDCLLRIKSMVSTAHAADVAPVVRCCDCKYHHDCGTHFCDRLGMDCPDDSEFFCKYGARMDGDSDAAD